MSITFTDPTAPMAIPREYECMCAWDGNPVADCDDCDGTGKVSIDQGRVHDVQMSNANAARVLEALGYEFDYCGELDPEELKRRVIDLIVKQPNDDYLAGRLVDLGVLASHAINHNSKVVFG